jgi:Ca2+-binding RTX toxin-like protein
LLNGGIGDHTLIGGSGADIFGFFGGNEPFSTSNLGVDRIVDFESNTDKIALFQPTFTVLTNTGGTIDSNEFAVVTDDIDVAISSAAIVYSIGTGNLFYNENGVEPGLGTGDQFATLVNRPSLSAADIIVGESLLNL